MQVAEIKKYAYIHVFKMTCMFACADGINYSLHPCEGLRKHDSTALEMVYRAYCLRLSVGSMYLQSVRLAVYQILTKLF